MWLYRGCHKRAFVPWPILVKMFSFSVLVKKKSIKNNKPTREIPKTGR